MEYSVYVFRRIICRAIPVSVKAFTVAFTKYVGILENSRESSVYTFYFFITFIFPSVLTIFFKKIFEIYLFKMI